LFWVVFVILYTYRYSNQFLLLENAINKFTAIYYSSDSVTNFLNDIISFA